MPRYWNGEKVQDFRWINGFGRVIHYYDNNADDEDEKMRFMYYLVEGELEDSMPSGFARILEPFHSFVGGLQDMVYTLNEPGIKWTGDGDIKYSGIYGDGQRWKYEKPDDEYDGEKDFRDFSF